jgi:hypothetical protein
MLIVFIILFILAAIFSFLFSHGLHILPFQTTYTFSLLLLT